MKYLVTILCLAAFAAHAFDSDDWLAKRAVLDREAERLQGVYAQCEKALRTPAENLVIPLENYPDGKVRSTITAHRAQFFRDEGFVWGEGVVIREFAPDGTLAAEVKAEHCVVDRETKSGVAIGHASAVYGGTTVEGDGIYFSFAEEFVKILSNVTIVSTDMKLDGVKL